MTNSRTYKNPASTRHKAATAPTNQSAVEQWRVRHELLRQALMAAQRKLKGSGKNKVTDTIELINKALVTDKKVVEIDE